jgi:hypothetical protein
VRPSFGWERYAQGLHCQCRDFGRDRRASGFADYGTWTTTFGGAPVIVKSFDLATHTGLVGIAKKF